MGEGQLHIITEIVQKHPALYYSTEIDDTRIRALPTDYDFFNDDFCHVWQEYNQALFDSIRQLVRYEKSLIAWNTLTEDIDGRVKDTIIMDYVYPVFRIACDIPNIFKDQIVRAAVKLEGVADGDYEILSQAEAGNSAYRGWFARFEKVCESDNSETRFCMTP